MPNPTAHGGWSAPDIRSSSHTGPVLFPSRAEAFALLFDPRDSSSTPSASANPTWSPPKIAGPPAAAQIKRIVKPEPPKPLDEASSLYGSVSASNFIDGVVIPQYLEHSPYARIVRRQSSGTSEVPSIHGTPAASGADWATRPLDDGPIGLLPSKWDIHDKDIPIEIVGNGLDLRLKPAEVARDSDERHAHSVRANRPIPRQVGIYYYEITLEGVTMPDQSVAIGLSTRKAALSRHIGWEQESWAYHSDDGNAFCSMPSGRAFGPQFGSGNTVGCGIDFLQDSIFFTLNGHLLGFPFPNDKPLPADIFPAVGLRKLGGQLHTNFGQQPFQFDIKSMYAEKKESVWREIRETSATELIEGWDEDDLVPAMVLQYLQHEGYVESARALAKEVIGVKQLISLHPNAMELQASQLQDDGAAKRQAIRGAVLNGDTDKATELTMRYYPKVLQSHPDVRFWLKCRKFVEMARSLMHLSHDSETQQPSTRVGEHELPAGHETVASHGEHNTFNGRLRNSSIARPHGAPVDFEAMLQQLIEYGQTLRVEYGDSRKPVVQKHLKQIFGLVSFNHLSKDELIARLSPHNDRNWVADKLISAILELEGKSKYALIEQVWMQTQSLLARMMESVRKELKDQRDRDAPKKETKPRQLSQVKAVFVDPCDICDSIQCDPLN